jgi:hypothetical protein
MRQLDFQNDDARELILSKIGKAGTLERKNRIITQQIYQEYFFFNPVYKSLLDKRTAILRKEWESPDKARNFLLNLPSLQQQVRYKRKRQKQAKHAYLEGVIDEK